MPKRNAIESIIVKAKYTTGVTASATEYNAKDASEFVGRCIDAGAHEISIQINVGKAVKKHFRSTISLKSEEQL